MKRTLLLLVAVSVLGCSDPHPIRVPVEFETVRWDEPPQVDSVLSVAFDEAQHVVIEGVILRYCENFFADATQWTDDARSVVSLYVLSRPPVGGVCNSQTQFRRYTASIEVQQPVAPGPAQWNVRVYHRNGRNRIPVPPISH